MQSILDRYLGIHTQALTLESQRMNVLAANLANVDTPNYKARDVDFKAALAAAENASGTGTAEASAQSALKYRVPLAPALDGNTVDEQLEQSAFAENSVRYQATLTFLNLKLRALLSAIAAS